MDLIYYDIVDNQIFTVPFFSTTQVLELFLLCIRGRPFLQAEHQIWTTT